MDVNHDGKFVLIGDWGTALGKGDGRFGAPIPLLSGTDGIVAVAPGDFNGDGKIGPAVASNTFDSTSRSLSTPSYVHILMGAGNGSFTVGKTISTGVLVNLIAEDLNADGLTDVLYTTSIAKGVLNYIDLTVAPTTSHSVKRRLLSGVAPGKVVPRSCRGRQQHRHQQRHAPPPQRNHRICCDGGQCAGRSR